MRVLSLFSGIGAFEKALTNLNINYELVNYCEIDKYAARAYSLIHNIPEDKNLKDVTQVNTRKLRDLDLITYGFPCQDISNAGYQKGFADEDGNTTRSGLFFEALRIIRETRPKIAIAENVKALTSKKFDSEFTTVLGSLSRLGYNNYYKILNAKDYGIPQNRERVFIISIKQDIDKGYTFPTAIILEKRLGDLLEEDADEKYFLSQDRVNSLLKHKERNKANGNGFGARFVTEDDIGSSLTTSPDKSAGQYLEIKQATNLCNDSQGVIIKTTTRGSDISNTLRASMYKQGARDLIENIKNGRGYEGVIEQGETLRIRKLTPLECFRLMGFDDRDFYILKTNGISDSQVYKQAGNSIVVNVIEKIFEELIKTYPGLFPFKPVDNQITLDDILKEV